MKDRLRGTVRLATASLRRIGSDELLEVFAEGDGYIADASIEGAALAYECSHGSTCERMVFRTCEFEHIDFRDATFRDVRFESCRFIGCAMDNSWLCRVDFFDCSAPGLSLTGSRLAGLFAISTDFSYANFSEASIDGFRLTDCRLVEAAMQRAKLKRASLAECDLTRLDVFGTKLAGVDVSTCTFQAPVLSADYRELRGVVVSPEQAVELARLLGICIVDT